MRGVTAVLGLSVLLLAIGSAARPQASEDGGYFPGRSWRVSTPEEQGLDSTPLLRMLEDIRDNGVGIDGIVIVRHGHLVFESYLAPYDADTVHNLKSSSKSVLSALVGIALREKVLDGVDQRVSELFPEYFASVDDPRKKDITLRHLLTMSAGIEWKEISPQADRLWRSSDWVGAAIGLPLTGAPGESFTYSTALTHLASAAIARKSGISTRAFAEKYLFDPVGIRAGLWRRDPQGIHWGGADLFLTPRDMARFGYLYLRNGTWNGRQVVPREWVAESTRAQVKTGGWGGIDDYGYWWWIAPGAHVAVGLGGQVIAVIPEQDLVVVFTGAVPEAVPFALLRKYIVPAIGSARLPPNPAAESAISTLERELEHPPPPARPADSPGGGPDLGQVFPAGAESVWIHRSADPVCEPGELLDGAREPRAEDRPAGGTRRPLPGDQPCELRRCPGGVQGCVDRSVFRQADLPSLPRATGRPGSHRSAVHVRREPRHDLRPQEDLRGPGAGTRGSGGDLRPRVVATDPRSAPRTEHHLAGCCNQLALLILGPGTAHAPAQPT